MIRFSQFAAVAAMAAAGSLAMSTAASALGVDTPEGFVPAFSGATNFGSTDGTPGGLSCPACDATVNFAVYSNKDRSDWASDVFVTPTYLNGADPTARWIFFYQIQNTNPMGGANADLENFNVTTTTKTGDPVEQNPYTSGGYLRSSDIGPFIIPSTLDTPNDWIVADIGGRDVAQGVADDTDPSNLLFTNASGPNPISSPGIRAGSQGYAGALFEFANPLIAPGSLSEVLFLTSNGKHIDFVWAETELPGGFGAAADVVGIKSEIPLPAPILLFIPALAALGAAARRRQAA